MAPNDVNLLSLAHDSSKALRNPSIQAAVLYLCALLSWVAMAWTPELGVAGIGRPLMNETGTFVIIVDDDDCLFRAK